MKQIVLASEFYSCQEPIIEAIGGVAGKQVLMIPTAAFGEGQELDPHKDTNPFTSRGATLNVFDLAGKSKEDVEKEVKKADVIYIRGGNTFYLLEHMRQSGFADVLQNYFQNGVYIGSSAGSCVLSPDIGYSAALDDPGKASLADYKGLGLVDFNFIPHANKPRYQEFLTSSYNQTHPEKTMVLADHQALLIENNHIKLLQED